MPIYEYDCPSCKQSFEEWLKFSDITDEHPCPNCNTMSKRMVSSTTFHLKGEGWHYTEYGSKKINPEKPEQADSEQSSSGETNSEQSSSGETNSEQSSSGETNSKQSSSSEMSSKKATSTNSSSKTSSTIKTHSSKTPSSNSTKSSSNSAE